eukprot:Skav223156  [mRNA]  locus=scaffold2973:107146:114194:- [translate_table: standard]
MYHYACIRWALGLLHALVGHLLAEAGLCLRLFIICLGPGTRSLRRQAMAQETLVTTSGGAAAGGERREVPVPEHREVPVPERQGVPVPAAPTGAPVSQEARVEAAGNSVEVAGSRPPVEVAVSRPPGLVADAVAAEQSRGVPGAHHVQSEEVAVSPFWSPARRAYERMAVEWDRQVGSGVEAPRGPGVFGGVPW